MRNIFVQIDAENNSLSRIIVENKGLEWMIL